MLTWNLGFNNQTTLSVSTSRQRILLSLVVEIRPSVVACQEASSSLRLPRYEIVRGPGKLVTAFDGSVWSETERTEFLTRGRGLGLLHKRTNRNVFIWNIHLESPLNGSSLASRREFVRDRLRPYIEAKRIPGRAEVIVGDFNLPPYDEVLMARGGLWANRSLEIAHHHHRKATAPRVPLFNPTWALLGIDRGICGTYYRSQQPDGEGPWHVIDQALISPSLAQGTRPHIRLVSRVSTTELCKKGLGVPDATIGSDHLPLTLSFEIT